MYDRARVTLLIRPGFHRPFKQILTSWPASSGGKALAPWLYDSACRFWVLSSRVASSSISTGFCCNALTRTGIFDLIERHSIRCAGLLPRACVGVFLYSNSIRNKLDPECSAFDIRDFTVFTALSALPFDCGWYGLESSWSIPQFFVNNLNSLLMNWGPLSLTRTCGMPYLAKFIFSLRITFDVEVSRFKWSTSQKLVR